MADPDDGRWHSGLSGTYWIVSGVTLLVGGIFIAVSINVLGGLVLAAMGVGAFWVASRSRSLL